MTAGAHAERDHALLSASASHRWLLCTPSARLEATLPDTTSRAAKEGTLAHEIAELKLRKYFTEPMGPQKFSAAMKKLKARLDDDGKPLYADEMDRHTDTYLEYLQKLAHSLTSPPYVAIEKRLDFSMYVPEGFGTGDFIAIGGGTLFINDFKYGKGVPVSAVDNPQMKLYALGAYHAYSFLFPIERVRMAIIQPRLNDISEDEISLADLLAWGESIEPRAAAAFAGEGEYTPGEHCGFCRARSTCRARVESLLDAAAPAPMRPPLITWAEAANILRRVESLGLIKWYNALKDDALAEVLKGGDVPGWKAVHGRGSREYVDIDAAFAHLQASGIEEALLYERRPLTVAAIEKVLKTKQYKELLADAGHVVTKPGSPTLVPSDDPRSAITDQVSAEQAFGDG